MSRYSEAFEKYIGRESPAYVERMKFSPAEACALIRRAGGLPVLAHPVFFDRYGKIKAAFDEASCCPRCWPQGLAGIEVYYTGYDAVTIEYLLGLARQLRPARYGRHGLPRRPTERARPRRRCTCR